MSGPTTATYTGSMSLGWDPPETVYKMALHSLLKKLRADQRILTDGTITFEIDWADSGEHVVNAVWRANRADR